MVDEKSEVESKKGISVLVMTLGCVASVLLGLAGGVLGGPTIKATLGMEVGRLLRHLLMVVAR